MKSPRTGVLLALIVAAAVALRLGAVAMRGNAPLVGDEPSYDSIARQVAAGHGYVAQRSDGRLLPTARRGPGYVLVIAACHRLFGPSPRPVFLVQVVLEALTVLLIHRLARRWGAPPAAALLAAAMYAVYPPFVLETAQLITETLTQFTIVLATSLFFEFLERPRARTLIGSAVSIGYCALSKPQVAPIAVVLCAAALPRVGLARALRLTAAMILVVGLTLSPWIAWNARVFHRFVPGVSTGGVGLWLGAGPVDGRVIGGFDGVPDSLHRAIDRMGEIDQNTWALHEAGRLIAANPGHYVELSVRKFLCLWFNLGYQGVRPSRASLLVAAFHLVAIALAFVGARRTRIDSTAQLYLVLLAIVWSAINVPFATTVRYAFPYYAMLFVLTAAGAWALATRQGRARTPAAGAPVAT